MEKDDWKLLQSKYSGVYWNCSSIAHHNEFASKAWTGVYRDVADRKSVRFQSSTRIHQARRIQKKKHPGKRFQKDLRFRCADYCLRVD